MTFQTNSVDKNGLARTPDGKLYVTLSSGATPILAGDGTAAAPSYSFASGTGAGMYRSSINGGPVLTYVNQPFLSMDTNNGTRANVTSLGFASAVTSGSDLMLERDAANVLAQRNGNTAQESRIYAGNGGFMSNVVCVNESLTIAAAATTDSALTVPAGAILLSASVRVTTVIPTAATFTVTTATGGTALNTAAVAVAAGSTDPGTAAGASYRSAATKIRITPSLTPGAATGVVRICAYYLQVTPPTS